MRKIVTIVLLLTSIGYLGACQNSDGGAAEKGGTLTADQYEKKLAETPGAQLVDVRTAGEYAEGHLANAVNMNVNREDYKEQFATLDKERPVFVYCLSGGRSADAVKIMRKMGFKEVYNLQGGILKWESAGKPLSQGTDPPKEPGMSSDDLNKLVSSGNYVLVDYNAPWCAPCMKLMPVLEALAEKKKDKLALVKVDADKNKALMQQKGISNIPYLELYDHGKLVWTHEGYIEESQLLEETKL